MRPASTSWERAVVGVSLALALVPGLVEPCECVTIQGKPWEIFAGANHVYLGKVIRVDHPEQYAETYTIKPLRVWKGSKKSYTLSTGGGCGFHLREGEYYLMYADEDPQGIDLCGPHPLPFCAALDHVAWLDRERGMPPTVVPGVDCSALRKPKRNR